MSVSQAVICVLPVLCLHGVGSVIWLPSFNSHHCLLSYRFIPQNLWQKELWLLIISEYSKISHFYLKEITYYK